MKYPQTGAREGDLVEGLREVVLTIRPGADVQLIERAYRVAAYRHEGQKRLSGHPYITHPVTVAAILAGLGADDQTLCAAILHDTVEDTPCTLAELRRDFGGGVATMVAEHTAFDHISGPLRKSWERGRRRPGLQGWRGGGRRTRGSRLAGSRQCGIPCGGWRR